MSGLYVCGQCGDVGVSCSAQACRHKHKVVSLDDRRPKACEVKTSVVTVEPDDVIDLLGYVYDSDTGAMAFAIPAPPAGAGAWQVSSVDDVERMGVLLFRLAAKMRGSVKKGPP